MDHMRNQLCKIVGIGSLSVLLQFSAVAQNATSTSSQPSQPGQSNSLQEKVTVSNSSSDPSSSTTSNPDKPASAPDATMKISSESAVATPKINPKNPNLNLKVTARESKTDARSFAAPELENMGEAQPFQATAYALKGRTRMGTQVRRGVIAADPRVLPLGSVVQLRAGKYSGVYTVHDTGKRIKGNVIDVWVPDRHEARQFGRQRIKLHVLRLGPQGRSKKK